MRKYLTYVFMTLLPIISLLFVSTTLVAKTNIPLKEPGVLNVIAYSEFKPISYGHGQGFEADLLRGIAQLWHVKIKFHPEPIYAGLWRLPSRSYTLSDVAIGGLSPKSYRIKEGALFSITTVSFNQSLLVRKQDYESGHITSYHSFKNTPMKIGVVPGTTGEQYAYIRAKKSGLSPDVLIPYASESELLTALFNKKIDAIARGEIGNQYQATRCPELVTIAKQDFHEGFALAIDKSNKILASQINQAIKKLTDNGKITYSQWTKNHNIFLNRAKELLRMSS